MNHSVAEVQHHLNQAHQNCDNYNQQFEAAILIIFSAQLLLLLHPYYLQFGTQSVKNN